VTIVTSNHTSPLGLPRGPVILPGRSVKVDNWYVLRNHAVVRSWLAAGVLSVEDGSAEPVKAEPAPVAAHDADIADLRSEYQELFGKRPFMGWSTDELRQKIDAKLAE
jgi:hypothetical protein